MLKGWMQPQKWQWAREMQWDNCQAIKWQPPVLTAHGHEQTHMVKVGIFQ